jgi:DNA recombination protein RmuC
MNGMETFLLILLILITAGFGLLILHMLQNRKAPQNTEGLIIFQNQLRDALRGLELQFSEYQRNLREQTQVFAKEMTEVKETSKQVLTITDQLRSLEKVLTHQKQRGNLGEAALELVMQNILPPGSYKLQYEFRDGKRADAVIFAKEGMIPVDAKFPLDNYERLLHEEDPARREELERMFKNDLKKRIDETAQYIKPEEGTLSFAVMFIPAEGIYYDLLVNEVGAVKVNTRNLIEYAYRDKNVVIVSPTTFTAYLQAILYGFRAFQIERSAEKLAKGVATLGKHLAAYEEYMRKIGVQLQTVQNTYVTATKEFAKVEKDILRLTDSQEKTKEAEPKKPSQKSLTLEGEE